MQGSQVRFLSWALVLTLALTTRVVAGGKQPNDKPAKRGQTGGALEVEPGPPLSLNVRLVNLQKNASGGVASVALDAQSVVDLKQLTITLTLPPDVTFADGSRVYTQTIDLAAGATFDIPKDLLVGKDGKYNFSIDASGATIQGKPVHRGLAYKLLVGAQDKLPPVKDGAIEYQGVPGGGN